MRMPGKGDLPPAFMLGNKVLTVCQCFVWQYEGRMERGGMRMAKRMFYGVDLEKNYAQEMLKEKDKAKKEKLRLHRDFKTIAMHLEKLLKKDVIVIDSSMKKWRIISARGRYIERKTFLLERIGTEGKNVCDATKIYPLEPFWKAKAKLENDRKMGWTTRETERRPRWFDIAEKVRGEGNGKSFNT